MSFIYFFAGVFVGMYFRPLLYGIFKAISLLLSPRKTLEERIAIQRYLRSQELSEVVREAEALSPALASELRHIAGRDS